MEELVLIGSCSGAFYAIDRNEGTPAWIYDVTADGSLEFHGDPLIAGELVFVGTDGGKGYVYAFDGESGEVRWKAPADEGVDGRAGFPADILRAGDLLVTAGIGDYVVALDLRDGARKWKFQGSAPRDRLRFPNPMALAGDRVFFGGLDGILYALDAKTGRVLWKRDLESRISTAVVTHGDAVIAGTANKRLFRVRQSDGSIAAFLDLPHAPAFTPVVHGDKLVVVTDRELFAVKASLAGIAWSRKAANEWSTPRPRIWNGAIVAGDGSDLYALDLATGRELWKERLGGVIRAVGSDEETLYVGTYGGDLFALRPRTRHQKE